MIEHQVCFRPRDCECPCDTCEDSRTALYAELQELQEGW